MRHLLCFSKRSQKLGAQEPVKVLPPASQPSRLSELIDEEGKVSGSLSVSCQVVSQSGFFFLGFCRFSFSFLFQSFIVCSYFYC